MRIAGAVTTVPVASTGWTTSRYTLPCLVGTTGVRVSIPKAAAASDAFTAASANAAASTTSRRSPCPRSACLITARVIATTQRGVKAEPFGASAGNARRLQARFGLNA